VRRCGWSTSAEARARKRCRSATPWAQADVGCRAGQGRGGHRGQDDRASPLSAADDEAAAEPAEDRSPALIAAVVGLHFLPFAWAFGERMFLVLGGAVAALGTAGLVVGALDVPHAAEVAAVSAGLVMLVLIVRYARGGFAPSR
jgi:hypothetical protein